MMMRIRKVLFFSFIKTNKTSLGFGLAIEAMEKYYRDRDYATVSGSRTHTLKMTRFLPRMINGPGFYLFIVLLSRVASLRRDARPSIVSQ